MNQTIFEYKTNETIFRTCFPCLGEDRDPKTKKSGIRSHFMLTAFFLNLLGKITYVKTSKDTLYLNKNSFNKWLSRQKISIDDPTNVKPEIILNNVMYNNSLKTAKKNITAGLVDLNNRKIVTNTKENAASNKNLVFDKILFDFLIQKNKIELKKELEDLKGMKRVETIKKELASQEKKGAGKTSNMTQTIASMAKKVGSSFVKAISPIDLSCADNSLACAGATISSVKQGKIKAAACSGLESIGWLANSCCKLFIPKEVREAIRLEKFGT